jgi:hypothetical protein
MSTYTPITDLTTLRNGDLVTVFHTDHRLFETGTFQDTDEYSPVIQTSKYPDGFYMNLASVEVVSAVRKSPDVPTASGIYQVKYSNGETFVYILAHNGDWSLVSPTTGKTHLDNEWEDVVSYTQVVDFK